VQKADTCEECGDVIGKDEEFIELEIDSPDASVPRRVVRLHTYLCWPTYRVKHRR
jgi:hypothetical protein